VCDTVLVLVGEEGPSPISDEFRAALATARLRAPKST